MADPITICTGDASKDAPSVSDKLSPQQQPPSTTPIEQGERPPQQEQPPTSTPIKHEERSPQQMSAPPPIKRESATDGEDRAILNHAHTLPRCATSVQWNRLQPTTVANWRRLQPTPHMLNALPGNRDPSVYAGIRMPRPLGHMFSVVNNGYNPYRYSSVGPEMMPTTAGRLQTCSPSPAPTPNPPSTPKSPLLSSLANPKPKDARQNGRKRPVVESDEDDGEEHSKTTKHQDKRHNGYVSDGDEVPKQKTMSEVTATEKGLNEVMTLGDRHECEARGVQHEENNHEDEYESMDEVEKMTGDKTDEESSDETTGESDEESGGEVDGESDDDLPLAIVTKKRQSESVFSSAPDADPLLGAEPISWKLPEYEIRVMPKKDEDTVMQVSIPGRLREQVILSHDHTAQELHLFKEVFLPGQQALETPENFPRVAILNFHNICVMVLDAYHAHQVGDLDLSKPTENGEPDQSKFEDARGIDVDDIFFASIDRWRMGLLPSQSISQDILKPAYAHIRGAQEFCDIALDIIHYIKGNGMLPPERTALSEKGAKRVPVAKESGTAKAPSRSKSSTNKLKQTTSTTKAITSSTRTSTNAKKDVGTTSNPHRPATRTKARYGPRKAIPNTISVIKRK